MFKGMRTQDYGTGPDFWTRLQLVLAFKEGQPVYDRERLRLIRGGKIQPRPLFGKKKNAGN